jgi:hypothetical protein
VDAEPHPVADAVLGQQRDLDLQLDEQEAREDQVEMAPIGRTDTLEEGAKGHAEASLTARAKAIDLLEDERRVILEEDTKSLQRAR